MSATLKYVSTGIMAEALGYTNQTVREYCEAGAFKGAWQTMGGHWRIPRKYFERAEVEKIIGKQSLPDQTPETPEMQETPETQTHHVDG
jgi:helix-turn-helix protein